MADLGEPIFPLDSVRLLASADAGNDFIGGDEPPALLLYGQDDDVVVAYKHERPAAAIEGGRRSTHYNLSRHNHIELISTFSPLGSETTVIKDITDFFRTYDAK